MRHLAFWLSLLACSPARATPSFTCDFQTSAEDAAPKCDIIGEDLATLQSLKFHHPSALHRKFFGKKDGGIYRFVTKHLRRVVIMKEDSPENSHVAADAGDDTIYIYPYYFTKDAVTRYMALVHESAHLGPDGRPHVKCPARYVWKAGDLSLPKPELAGQSACDRTDTGAYAYGFVFLRSVATTCVNCEDKMSEEDAVSASVESIYHISNPAAVERLLDGTN
jgi:hypothetical protein